MNEREISYNDYLNLPVIEKHIEGKTSTDVYRAPKVGKLYRDPDIKPRVFQVLECTEIIRINRQSPKISDIKSMHIMATKVRIIKDE